MRSSADWTRLPQRVAKNLPIASNRGVDSPPELRFVTESPQLRGYLLALTGDAHLADDLLQLIGRFNRADDGTVVVPSEYLEVVITRA